MSLKTERLMNLVIMLLDARNPVTADEIRKTVPGYSRDSADAFKRMFERDKEELREMGIPLEIGFTDVWERERGYRIPKERYYLPELHLAPEETASLWMAASLLRVADPYTARSALLKMSEGIPPPEARPSSLAVDAALSAPGLTQAFDAVADHKTLVFDYRRDESVAERTVDPYGLVHRRGCWYLVGRDHSRDAVRSFRLDRVAGNLRYSDPSGTGGEYEPPKGFNPAAALEAPPFTQGDDVIHLATVRFDSQSAWLAERHHPWLAFTHDADGSATVQVRVTDVDGFASWVLWQGEGAEVEGPESLRAAIRERLEALCA